jgi:hypothetical protein
MSPCPRRGLLPLFLLLWLVLPAPARAAGGVEDRAGLFGRDARNQADDAIEEIRRQTHKDLLIEAVNKLPPEKLKEYTGLKSEAERGRFFRDLAEEHARRSDVDGVYVLLCRVPSAAEAPHGFARFLPRKFTELLPPQAVGRAVVVWPATNEAYFPRADCEKLDGLFAGIKVAEHNQDQALLEAVKFVGQELAANARALGAPPADTFRWTDVLWAAAALAAAWVVLGFVRARVASRQGATGPVPGANQGSAALFGLAGGLWLFEAYRAGRKEPSPAAAPPTAPETDDRPAVGPTHPDDLDAISRGTDPWTAEDTEATTGHERP